MGTLAAALNNVKLQAAAGALGLCEHSPMILRERQFVLERHRKRAAFGIAWELRLAGNLVSRIWFIPVQVFFVS